MTPTRAVAKRPSPDVEPSHQFYGTCTLISWVPESKALSYPKWEEAGKVMGVFGRSLQWWMADWLKWGEDRYGEKFAQALEGTGRDEKTLLTWLRVARAVEVERRREELTFSHHAVVSALDPEAQTYWLGKAIEGDRKPNGEVVLWSSHRLKAEISAGGQPVPPEIDVEVVDKELVPREYLVPDVKAIREAYAKGTREIPGLKITEEPA